MAVVNGTIIGTGQVVRIEIPSARVPELPDFEEIADDDELAGYDTSENKTKGMKISQLRAKINGSAIPQTPVVSGADMEILIPPELNGQTRIDVPALAGLDYWIERIGPEASSRYVSTWYDTLSTGGWELNRSGDKFYAGEYWIAHIYALEGGNSTTPGPTAGQADKGFKLIDATYALVPDDVGYTFNISAGTNKPVITLPSVTEVPDKSTLPFETMINNTWQTTIQTKNGEFIYFKGQALTKIYMGLGETFNVKRADDGWYVIPGTWGNYLDAGQPVAGYSSMLNTLVAEGQEVRRDSYPRLWEAVQLMGDSLVDETTWQSSINYRGCYSTGTSPDTFRLPDLRGTSPRFLDRGRGLETNPRAHNFPGGYQADAVGNFLPSPDFNLLLKRSNGGEHETAATFAPGGRPVTWPNITTSQQITSLKSETTMKNTGFLALIRT